jgi:chorismate-pyruvate lyase
MYLSENSTTLEQRQFVPDTSIIHDKSQNLFQKILLTTDGTVTNLLKLYAGESIQVKKIKQEIVLSGELETFLCSLETPVLKRNILLSGKTRNYVYCESILVFELLSRSIQYKLLETDQPIGLMWKEEKLETYKEVIDYKTEPAGVIAQYFGIQPQVEMLSRTYLIYHNQKAFGAITEKFPVTYFKEK